MGDMVIFDDNKMNRKMMVLSYSWLFIFGFIAYLIYVFLNTPKGSLIVFLVFLLFLYYMRGIYIISMNYITAITFNNNILFIKINESGKSIVYEIDKFENFEIEYKESLFLMPSSLLINPEIFIQFKYNKKIIAKQYSIGKWDRNEMIKMGQLFNSIGIEKTFPKHVFKQ